MKPYISKAQIDLFFTILERLKADARESGCQEIKMDLDVLGNIADQWLLKYGYVVDLQKKAEHKLSLVPRVER